MTLLVKYPITVKPARPRRWLRPLTLVALLASLGACGSLGKKPATASSAAEPASSGELSKRAPSPTSDNGRFSADTLYSLLVAEVASSRQLFDITLENYTAQARQTGDLNVIKRAARLAQYFRAYKKSADMGRLWIAAEPDSLEAHALLATAYIELRQFNQAVDTSALLLGLIDPDNPRANQQAALVETLVNRSQRQPKAVLQKLLARYQSLQREYPQVVPVRVGISKLQEFLGENQPAYQTINEALAIDREYVPAILQQVRLLRLGGNNDEAIRIIRQQLGETPDNKSLQLIYARVLLETDARAAYEEISKLSADTDQTDIQFLHALAAMEIDELDVAKDLLQQLLDKNYQPQRIRFYLGNVENALGNRDQAIDYYLSVKSGEDFVAAQAVAGRLIIEDEGIERAQQHFARQRQQSPGYEAPLYSAEANLLGSQGEPELALQVLDEGISKFPNDSNLLYNRSTLHEQNDRLDLMEVDLRQILRLNPNNASALNALGYVLTARTERHQEALPLIERALSIRPDDPAIIDSMGWVLFNLGRHEEAITYLQKAYAIFPDPEVAAHLGEALWVVGRQQEARSIWRENLADNPDSGFVRDTIKRLNVGNL